MRGGRQVIAALAWFSGSFVPWPVIPLGGILHCNISSNAALKTGASISLFNDE
jgi:hypothetical protein